MRTNPRRRARELVLQGLYERQLAGSPAAQVFADLAASGG
jgi:transcription termination factor NusB